MMELEGHQNKREEEYAKVERAYIDEACLGHRLWERV
jgi:hypothetical protein